MLFVLSGHLLGKHGAEAFLVGTQGVAALIGDAAVLAFDCKYSEIVDEKQIIEEKTTL